DWRGVVRSLWETMRSARGVFWGLWIAPAFVFLWLVDSTEPGHDLLFAVALCALGAGLVGATLDTLPRLIAGSVALVALQATVFLFASPLSDRPLAWTANSMLLNVTAPGLRSSQA